MNTTFGHRVSRLFSCAGTRGNKRDAPCTHQPSPTHPNMPKGQDSPGKMSGLRTSTPTQGSPLRTSLRTSKPTQDSPLRMSLRGTIGDDEEDQIEPVARRLPSLRLLSPGSSKNKHASPPVEPPSELWLDGMVSDSSTVDDDDDLGGLTVEMEDMGEAEDPRPQGGGGGAAPKAKRRQRGSARRRGKRRRGGSREAAVKKGTLQRSRGETFEADATPRRAKKAGCFSKLLSALSFGGKKQSKAVVGMELGGDVSRTLWPPSQFGLTPPGPSFAGYLFIDFRILSPCCRGALNKLKFDKSNAAMETVDAPPL
eukprot:COSAG01_NODE_9141_length_2540_cov_1.867268_3_plen_311_part_00